MDRGESEGGLTGPKSSLDTFLTGGMSCNDDLRGNENPDILDDGTGCHAKRRATSC
jgi:hypothetical protein